MSELVIYDEACRAIAAAVSTDEVKEIHDKAEAMRVYAKRARNKILEVQAAEIRLRAERRLGEMILAQKEAGGLSEGGRPSKTSAGAAPVSTPTLAEVFGTTPDAAKKLSSRAQKLAAIPEAEFESELSEWRERVSKETERVTTNLIRKGERAQRDSKLGRPDLPDGQYSLIYADPPWRYEHTKTRSREVENQYPTMSLDEICELDVASITAPDCVLFLWSPSPKLFEALNVLTAWGFEYKTNAVWDKERMGMGYYFRQQHEVLLVATKGSPGTPDPADRPDSIIRIRRDPKHSAKPPEVAELLERMYPQAVRVELFCRSPRDGWEAWGNQA